jgi:hypothetical protein
MSEVFLTLTFCLSVFNSIALGLLVFAIRLELKTRETKRKLQSPSMELEDFMSDLKTHGCGMIRVDPASVFLRGRKDGQ